MPPKTMGLARKNKGAIVTTPSKKQRKKAAKWAQAPVAPGKDLAATDWETDGIGDKAVPTLRDEMVQRMDNMMAMIRDLTHKIYGSDPQQMERATLPLGSPPMPLDDWRRVRCQTNHLYPPTGHLRTMRKRIEQHLHQLPFHEDDSSDENVSSDQDQPASHKGRPLK